MILTNCAACAAPLAHDHKKRCSRCMFGGAHPTTAGIERHLRNARAILSIHENAPTCVAIFAAAALALAVAYLARKKLT